MRLGKIKRIDVVSLGCSKNLVDSEKLMAQLAVHGIEVVHDSSEPKGEVVIVNTCGFIGDAKEESIDTILQFAEAKREGRVKRLYVMGCLSQRYSEALKEAIPEVDKFYGKYDWDGIVGELQLERGECTHNERMLTTPNHYAYLKISEGCNRMCSYCAIPLITGRYKSRDIEDILAEAEMLRDKGVRELQVIAQDLSSYGLDVYGESRLAELTQRLTEIEGIEWVRLHYAYPTEFPYDILRVMAENPKVCSYMDLALQHASDSMLKKMLRKITKAETKALLEEIRSKVPNIHIRTTLLVGHPGETEADFEELKEFVKEMRFERLGVFPYSHEEDTYSWRHYADDIPEEEKHRRADIIMEMQSGISAEINEGKVGKVMKVIVDRMEGDVYVGRTEYDSPEVDPEVVIETDMELEIGEFYDVRITMAEEYDLIGEIEK